MTDEGATMHIAAVVCLGPALPMTVLAPGLAFALMLGAFGVGVYGLCSRGVL